MTRNMKAFLDTLAQSEGTYGHGDDGYNVLVGGELFHSYKDHPRKRIFIKSLGISSTAAGRYQILARFYDAYAKLLKLTDFSPASQDAIAMQMIKEQGAQGLINDGHFDQAIDKCSNIWASLPGAGYGQHENKMTALRADFVSNGGVLA